MSHDRIAVVTGGAGFIGSHLVDVLLRDGFAVRVLDDLSGGHRSNLAHHDDNPGLACSWRDVRSLAPEDPVFGGAKYVFHLAGIGVACRSRYRGCCGIPLLVPPACA